MLLAQPERAQRVEQGLCGVDEDGERLVVGRGAGGLEQQ